MAILTMRLLGLPEVRVGERPLSFRTRKVLALLVYLVVEGGLHSRESLMALLWPESASQSAAGSLRVTLSRLRRALRPAGDVLIGDTGVVGFNPDAAYDLDLDWLAAAVLPEMPPDELMGLLDLDRGEFLEGFALPDAPAFDSWAATQREGCQRQVETVYDHLSQHLLATRNSAAAVETAARWVARAPLSEGAYRRLMAAQALSGERAAALRTYQQLRDVLQEELGLEPGRESAVLAENINLGRLGQRRAGSTAAVGAARDRELGRQLVLPLTGRSEEHGRLVDAFHRTGQAGAQVVAIIGAAGVGKTRLVSTFHEWVMLESPGAEIWAGQAFETGGRLAFQPVVDALRLRLEGVNAPEDLLEDVWLAELSQLMPELRARYPDLPPPMTGDAHYVRARLFEAVAVLGSALATGHRSVLILDDMQWADADTFDLIHYLARRWAEMGAPILLLLLIRQEAYAADAALREWLTRLERDTSLGRLLLDNLSGEAVEKLVKSLAKEGAGERATSAFAAWLWAETQGLPFFIEALLQMLVEQGFLQAVDETRPGYDFGMALEHVRSVARVPLPPGVREVIRARLAQQSKEASGLLLAASVLGRACTFERMCQVAGLAEGACLEPLEELLARRLLSERPTDWRPYTVAHDYIREVAYSESGAARRRVHHRRALLALEAAAAPAAECAFHALAALLDEPAFRFSVAAGSEAFAAYALQEALSRFDAAREVAQHMRERGEGLDTELLGHLYSQRGQVLELLKEDGAAEANYEEMRAEAIQEGDKAMELAGLIAQCTLHGRYSGAFNPLKAIALGNEALALAEELGDRAAEASALWGVAVARLYSAGDIKLVTADAQQALSLARELSLQELQGRILINFCWPLVAQKQLAQALASLREAQTIWRDLNNLPRLAEASRFVLLLFSITGDHQGILAEAPQVSALGTSIGSSQDEAEPYLSLVYGHARQGRFAAALSYLEKYEAYVKTVGTLNDLHGHLWVRVRFYLVVGALEEAERWANMLLAERETIMPNFTSLYLIQVARTKIARGKLEEGRILLDDLLAQLPQDAVWSYNIITIMQGYGELHLALGQPEALFAGLEERARPYRAAGFIYELADEYWVRGRAHLALGQLGEARETLLLAREAAEAQEERAILWRILAAQSELERACGDEAAAARLASEARALVDDIASHAGAIRSAFLAQPAIAQLRAAV